MYDELFLQVEDWPDYYVSAKGNIASNKTGRLIILKQSENSGGYLQVTLFNKKMKKIFRTHRLVALVWLNNPDNLPIVDHIDRDKKNNNVENLRWVTKSQNELNIKSDGGISIRKDRKKKYQARIRIYDKDSHIVGVGSKRYCKHFLTFEEAEKWLEEKRKERDEIHDNLIF